MLAQPTTTVTLFTGSGVDEYGDETDGSTIAASGVYASVIEAGKTVQDPATGTPRVVRTHTGRLPHGTPIAGVNRIRDERTDNLYIVDSYTAPANPVWPQDIHLDLRIITAT